MIPLTDHTYSMRMIVQELGLSLNADTQAEEPMASDEATPGPGKKKPLRRQGITAQQLTVLVAGVAFIAAALTLFPVLLLMRRLSKARRNLDTGQQTDGTFASVQGGDVEVCSSPSPAMLTSFVLP